MISMGVRRSLRTLLRLATAVVGSILKEGLNKSILGRLKSAMQKTSFMFRLIINGLRRRMAAHICVAGNL